MQTLALSIPHSQPLTRRLAQSLCFTALGVGTLFVLGKGIGLIGQASGLSTSCWQLTGARAAAATLVVGLMARFRVGHLALFGLLYGATMLSTHTNWTLLGSAALAGIAAWAAYTLYTARRAPSLLGILLPSLAYTLTVTLSGLITALTASTARQNLGTWTSGVGIRAGATMIAAIVLWLAVRPRQQASL